MNKLSVFIAVFVLGLISSAYAVKSGLHKKVFGETSKIVYFIEKTLGHKPPLFDGDIVGNNAPNFSLNQVDGKIMTLTDYKGKLVILNFWASWCPPCRAEIPAFVNAQEKYRDKGVAFLGIAIEDKADVETFLKEVSINYPTSYGVEEAFKVSAAYGNPDGALPYTLVIGPKQKILESHNGQVTEAMLDQFINKHLIN